MIMRRLFQAISSWLAVLSGFGAGLYALAIFADSSLPVGDPFPWWYSFWIADAGYGLLGAGFVLGTIAALWNRKRAGSICLVFAPFAAFCLAYPSAGFLIWAADGNGYFHKPPIATAIGLAVVFYSPFLAPLLAARRRRLAIGLFAGSAAIAAMVFGFSRWTSVLAPRLAGWSTPLLAFGLFWLATHRSGWPPLVEACPRRVSRRIALALAMCLLIVMLCAGVSLGRAAWWSFPHDAACREGYLRARPADPNHVVFTARILRAGHLAQYSGRWVGYWAIGIVQRKFWGLPSWVPRLVLLKDSVFWEKETYFIDSRRADGILTQFLPVVSVQPCRTRPAAAAAAALRVLGRARSWEGARVIGFVGKPQPYSGGLRPPAPPSPFAGASLTLSGPDGARSITTDSAGIFDVENLAPGGYTLELQIPGKRAMGFRPGEQTCVSFRLARGDLQEWSFNQF